MRKLYLLFFVVLFYQTCLGQSADPSFQGSISSPVTPESALYLPDGKYILWNETSTFTKVNGQPVRGIACFNADGTIDGTFQVGTGFVGAVHHVARQSDGKLIIGGKFSSYNGQAVSSGVIRLNANGTLDATFNPGIRFNNFNVRIAAYFQADGKMLITGPVVAIGQTDVAERIIRLNANGTWDQTFNAETTNGDINSIVFQPDGKFIAGGVFTSVGSLNVGRIARFNANGTYDNTFNTSGAGFDGTVNQIRITSTGRILAAGSFTTYNGAAMKYLVALTSAGAVDGTFTQNGTPNGVVYGLALQSDGKIVLAGSITAIGATTINKMARLQVNGAVDATFSTNMGTGPVNGSVLNFVTVNADDDILILGYSTFSSFNGMSRNSIALLESTGTLKPMTQALTLESRGSVTHLVAQGNQLLVAHMATLANGLASSGFERLNADGTLDATFRSGLTLDNSVYSIFIDKDGNILIGGNFTSYKGSTVGRIARLDANGNIDNTFRTNNGTGFNGSVSAFAQQTDGKLIVGGGFASFNGVTRNKLVRLNTDGTIDNTFNAANGFGASGSVQEIRIQTDGKILVGGDFTSFAGNTIKSLVRLNSDGTLDNTFSIGTGLERQGGASSGVYAIQVLDNGKILVGGSFDKMNTTTNANYFIRLNSDGTLDTQMGHFGVSIVDAFIKQPNGQILMAERSQGLSRLNSDGTPDVTFTPVAVDGSISTVAVAGSSIFIGGYISVAGGTSITGIGKIVVPSAPAAPTVLNGSAAAPTQVTLTWQDNASNETGFGIERSLTSNANFTVITTRSANITTYTDNTAQPNTKYYYRVRAYNAGGYSAYSNVKEITTPQSIPTAPTMTGITALSSSTLKIDWTDKSNNEQNFLVKRSLNNTDYTLIATLPANTATYEDTGLTPAVRYYYRVSAVNEAGESTYAFDYEWAGGFTMTAGTISACGGYLFDPGGEWASYAKNSDITTVLQPDAAGSSVALTFETFNTVAGFDALSIYDGSSITAPLIGTYSGSQLPPKVRASNAEGTLTLRFQSSAQTPLSGWKAKLSCAIIPVKPSDIYLHQVNLNQIDIYWSDNATNEAGYELERSVGDNKHYVRMATLKADATHYADNTTERDKTYYYRVRATGTSDHSDYAAEKALAYGDGGTWILMKEFSGLARTDAIGFGLGQKGYVGTGLTGTYAMDVRAYAPATDTWTTVAGFGGSIRAEAVSFVIGTRAYVGLGEEGFGAENTKDLWEYNDQTNAWTQRADFPGTARRNAVAFVVNGKAYVGGGIDDTGRKNDFFEYNPTSNTWALVAAFPGDAREGAVAFSIGNDGYVGTGRTATARTKDIWKYTPATNTWTRVADFPGLAREEAVAFVVDDKAYVGTGDSGKGEKDFYRYDPTTNTWTKIVSFGGSARYVATSFNVGNNGYVATGFDGSNLKDVWELTTYSSTIAPPAAPSALKATPVSSTRIDVSWTDNTTDEFGFILERSVTDESNYIAFDTLDADVVSYSDNSLTANTKYYYRVKTVTYSAGNSLYAAAVSATTLPVPPQAPTNLAASAISHTQIRLTWTDQATNESQFVIERALAETGDFVEVGTAFANATTYNNFDLASSTTYYYRVKATNNGGSSPYTSVVSATTLVSPVAAPSNLTATVITGTPLKVKLQWTDNSNNETNFQLQRAVTGTQNYFTIANLGPTLTSFDDATVAEGASYTYRVRAVKGTDLSNFSATATVATPRTIPAAPSQLTVTLDETLTVAHLEWWRNSMNEDGFVIERSINGGPFIAIDTVTTLAFDDTDLTASLTVRYRVYAYNTAGKSAASNVAALVTTGIEEEQWHRTLGAYPNPAENEMTIEINDPYRGVVQFSWHNLQGQLLRAYAKDKSGQSHSHVVHAREFNSGVLILKVTMGNRSVVRKIVVR